MYFDNNLIEVGQLVSMWCAIVPLWPYTLPESGEIKVYRPIHQQVLYAAAIFQYMLLLGGQNFGRAAVSYYGIGRKKSGSYKDKSVQLLTISKCHVVCIGFCQSPVIFC